MPIAILEFDQATVGAIGVYDSSVSEITLTIEPGGLSVVLLEKEQVRLPLADLAAGILAPEEGRVRFRGQDWPALTPGAAADTRRDIGRVFEGSPWIRDCGVGRNIMLAQLHHTHRPVADITRDAEGLSRAFGLPGLPLGLPSTVRGKDLARAACVRAFMGRPDLLLLERPTEGVYPELLPPLLNMLRGARDRGAAVFWLTDNPDVWDNSAIHATMRARMYGGRMYQEREDRR